MSVKLAGDDEETYWLFGVLVSCVHSKGRYLTFVLQFVWSSVDGIRLSSLMYYMREMEFLKNNAIL